MEFFQKKFLLDLAHESLKEYFRKGKISTEYYRLVKKSIKDERLNIKRGVFVTLADQQGRLHGCIGHIEAIQPIWKDVIDNAVSAAFFDPRFYPLKERDLKKICIEISILSPLEKLGYQNTEDLLNKIKPNQDGLLIRKDFHQATFLPQVWERLNSKEGFLSHLCLKAGLESEEWRRGDLEVYKYEVEKIKEEY